MISSILTLLLTFTHDITDVLQTMCFYTGLYLFYSIPLFLTMCTKFVYKYTLSHIFPSSYSPVVLLLTVFICSSDTRNFCMYIPKQRSRPNSFNAVTSRFLAGVLPLLGAQNRAQFHHLAFAPAGFTMCYIFLRTTRPKISIPYF